MMYGLLLARYLAHSTPRLVDVPCGPLDTSLWVAWTCGQGAEGWVLDPTAGTAWASSLPRTVNTVGLPTLGLEEFLLPAISSYYPISHIGCHCCEV